MHVFLALLFMSICGSLIIYAILRPGPVVIFMATQSLFAIGHYGLPMLLVERSELRYLPENEISQVIAMALIFLIAILLGIFLLMRTEKSIGGISFPVLDAVFERNWWPGAILSIATVLAYYGLRNVTFYQTDSVEAFFEGRSSFEGLLGFLVGFAQAAMALYGVQAWRARRWGRFAFVIIALLIELALVSRAGQRLVFIAPILTLFAVLIAQRDYRTAGVTLVAAIAALVLISPFAVALRSGSWNNAQDSIASSFTYGDDPIDTMLQSIVDRGDVLVNMTYLKSYVDTHGYVGPTYYYSVLAIPIPRFIYPTKPYVLSDTGTVDGEASVLAWRLKIGNTLGSLTAFGAMVAYREGGWLWMTINGILTGMLFAWVFTVGSRGGFVGQVVFGVAFVDWAIRKVPPSLFEALVTVITYLPVILLLIVIDRLMQGNPVGRIEPGAPGNLAVQTSAS